MTKTNRYHIIDTLGGLQSTIKANSQTEALEIFKGQNTWFEGGVFALAMSDVDNFKTNVKKLKKLNIN